MSLGELAGESGTSGSEGLPAEVLELTQRLIRVDTTNGNETAAAEVLADYLRAAGGIEVEIPARDPARGNLVARLPGADPAAPSLAFVGHLDVVPADPRDWSHPPFAAEVDDRGYLFGRGAVDMKNEVAARAVALARLSRQGFRPTGDLLLIAVADEEDGSADVGMRWLLETRPGLRPTYAVNEGGGQRLELADGRSVLTLSIGEKGTQPVRVVARGEAGHASMPTLGRNAVPMLAELLRAVGIGVARPSPAGLAWLAPTLSVLVGEEPTSLAELSRVVERAAELHPALRHGLPPLMGTTMAPTLLTGSTARNVMPARASADLDCRVLPGATADEVLAEVAQLLGDTLPYDLEVPEALVPGSASPANGPVPAAIAEVMAELDPQAQLLPLICTGYTDSSFLRAAGEVAAYGFSPFRTTPAEVLDAGYHNADERVHVDDLTLSVRFHEQLARRLLGGAAASS